MKIFYSDKLKEDEMVRVITENDVIIELIINEKYVNKNEVLQVKVEEKDDELRNAIEDIVKRIKKLNMEE